MLLNEAVEDLHDRVPISITAGKALVFDIEVIKRLRSLGVGGVLSGTLPTAPQQNIFLGIPLQLMVEEVVWLVKNNYAYLIPDEKYIQELIDGLSADDVQDIQQSRSNEFKLQKNIKLEQLNAKLKALNKNNSQDDKKDSMVYQSLMIHIADNSNSVPNSDLLKSIYQRNEVLQQSLLKSLKYNDLNYAVFSYLKQKGYFLAPGLRFGGKFIGYPGDPLRYHAHLVVNTVGWEEDIGMMNIVNGGRLATGVKKVWLIGSEKDNTDEEDKEDSVVCFSVEWAGFG